MEVKLVTSYDEGVVHRLYIDDDQDRYICSLSDCPEDACIGRDLIDGQDIIEYIKLGYQLAKEGKSLDIIQVDRYGEEHKETLSPDDDE